MANYDWDLVNGGTPDFPPLFDFSSLTVLREVTWRRNERVGAYVAGPEVQQVLDTKTAQAAISNRKTMPGAAIVGEVQRAYAAYTAQAAGFPFAVQNDRDAKHLVTIAEFLIDVQISVGDLCRFFVDVRGIGFMKSRFMTLGYLAGQGQHLEARAWLLQQQRAQPTAAPSANNSAASPTINSFETADASARRRLEAAGFTGLTDAQVQTALKASLLLKQNSRAFVPAAVRKQAEALLPSGGQS